MLLQELKFYGVAMAQTNEMRSSKTDKQAAGVSVGLPRPSITPLAPCGSFTLA